MSKDRIYTILSRKLTGEATPAELAELDDLIKSYPDSHLPAQIIEEFWQAPSEQDEDFIEATYYLHLKRLEQKELEVNNPISDEATPPTEKKSNKKNNQLTIDYKLLESKANAVELEGIKYKMNPHLFKNILNSIQSHAYQTYFALDKLSNVLDYILYETDKKHVTVKEEIEFALNLIEINKLKFQWLMSQMVGMQYTQLML